MLSVGVRRVAAGLITGVNTVGVGSADEIAHPVNKNRRENIKSCCLRRTLKFLTRFVKSTLP
jgi:hypothetical protein